jgi:hypothetical protein
MASHNNIWFLILQHKFCYDLCFFIDTNHFTIKIADYKEESTFKFTKSSGYKLVDDKLKLRSKERLKIKGKIQKIPKQTVSCRNGGTEY